MRPSPRIAIVAGSGLRLEGILDSREEEVPFEAVPGLAATGVSGHAGTFIFGRTGGVPIVLQLGRLHFYEGLGHEAITRPVEVLAGFGVRTILFTNAAGGLKPEMRTGDILAASAISLWPCVRWETQPGRLALDGVLPGCDWIGTYHWVHGPSYETRAEIAALQALGCDAVGMSTAPEAARCRELGICALAVSCITNNCCHPQVLTHEDVLSAARMASERLESIIRASLGSLEQREPLEAKGDMGEYR